MQENKGNAILPVAAGYVKTPNDSLQDRRLSVFYDSGAQISLIRNEVAESLNLENRPVKVLTT